MLHLTHAIVPGSTPGGGPEQSTLVVGSLVGSLDGEAAGEASQNRPGIVCSVSSAWPGSGQPERVDATMLASDCDRFDSTKVRLTAPTSRPPASGRDRPAERAPRHPGAPTGCPGGICYASAP
jgi:hypothetical protein